MFFGMWLKGVPQAGIAPQEHGAAPNKFLCSPLMPAGNGSRPSSASSGAVEAECQHAAEADDFDGYCGKYPGVSVPVRQSGDPLMCSSCMFVSALQAV